MAAVDFPFCHDDISSLDRISLPTNGTSAMSQIFSSKDSEVVFRVPRLTTVRPVAPEVLTCFRCAISNIDDLRVVELLEDTVVPTALLVMLRLR